MTTVELIEVVLPASPQVIEVVVPQSIAVLDVVMPGIQGPAGQVGPQGQQGPAGPPADTSTISLDGGNF